MLIKESTLRRIIREEARRVLSEETIVAGLTVSQIQQIATEFAVNRAKSTAKNSAVGQATGLATPLPVSLEAGVVTISAPAVVPYIMSTALIGTIVIMLDAAYRALEIGYDALKAINEAEARNTAAAISQARILLWTAGINAGKKQGIFSPAILASLGPTYQKYATIKTAQKINHFRAMAYGEYPIELSQADKANVAVVFSMLTSVDIDKAFSDAKQAVISSDSSKINDEIYNTTIADFKTKLAAMQQAVMEEIAKLRVQQTIQQGYADQAKEQQNPAWQAAEQARLATLGREADRADFDQGIVPASYKPVKR